MLAIFILNAIQDDEIRVGGLDNILGPKTCGNGELVLYRDSGRFLAIFNFLENSLSLGKSRFFNNYILFILC